MPSVIQIRCRNALVTTHRRFKKIIRLSTSWSLPVREVGVLGRSRPSFRFLMHHLKDVPTTFLRCCRFPKFILHTEHCNTWQWSGTTSHSSQTRLKIFTEANFPAASFCSMEIFLMWVTTKLEDRQLLLAGWPFLVSWPRAHRLSCQLVLLF